jgi:hypothetical protein
MPKQHKSHLNRENLLFNPMEIDIQQNIKYQINFKVNSR